MENTSKIKGLLSQVHIVSIQDAMAVMDAIKGYMPQIIRVYQSQVATNSLLRSKLTTLTGRIDELELHASTTELDPVEEVKLKKDTQPLFEEDEAVDTDAALAELKAAIETDKPKKKAKKLVKDPISGIH